MTRGTTATSHFKRSVPTRQRGDAASTPRTGPLTVDTDEIPSPVMNKAFETEELTPYFMPIVRIGDQRCIGAEVLSRWNHPRFGLLAPDQYLPTMQGAGLIMMHDRKMACAAFASIAPVARRMRSDNSPWVTHVNLTAASLADPDVGNWVPEATQRAGMLPQEVALELTEGEFLTVTPTIRANLMALTDMGFRIVLDDFGTCYSGLTYLQESFFAGIKLDRCFVENLASDESGRSAGIVSAVMSLSRSVGVDVVFEGIETTDQAEILCQLGGEAAQGYLYCEPIPATELVWYLEHNRQTR